MKRILLITFLILTQHLNAADCLKNIYKKASTAAEHSAAPGATGFLSGYTLGKCLPCEQACTLSIGTGAGALSAHAAKECAPDRCTPCLEKTKNCLQCMHCRPYTLANPYTRYYNRTSLYS